ncbi:polysaccharide biosynthesis tyrosine autokinase [Solwaraspora sp. WMMD1047]|uniref:polysaccharide biosynthesis tyrosine autokinase n=1 Tax=Solwaraspora sp. WMMD1047 TaxID=3016102 RepID=UPI0024175CD3|nr:polysaccharide biosynthesis tyrosine autokinase [Solwaraspora sp. WMMD1047]MDG4830966.1 polysaccharide biosynthesis tyrosine autokinase [Solwaraspora sp. WMMD1047]
MDLQSHLRLVRQRWWVVLSTILVALGVAGVVTIRSEPQYASSVTFFVTIPSQGVTDAYQGGLFLQQRVKSYTDLLTSDRLARGIAGQEGIGLTPAEVQSRVSAEMLADKVLLTASVTDPDPARSLRLTEALVTQFVALVQVIETPPGAQQAPIKVEVVGGPRVGTEPVSPQPARNLALAGVLGLVLGVALSVLRGISDNTVRDGATLRRVTDTPLLGEVPLVDTTDLVPLMAGRAANSVQAEALRKIRTNLRFVDVNEPARVIAVTSAVQGEGKSTISCNLAIALAEAGWQVLLVDADLRRPRVADYLGVESGAGLTDVLIGETSVDDVVRPWGDKSLLVLPAGSTPPNPSELLGSKAMADLLLELKGMTDIVIIDTPPLQAVTDGVVVAVQSDGALLVTRHAKTSQGQAIAAAQALRAVGARLLGCVLNMTKLTKADSYQYEAYRARPTAQPAIAEPVDLPRPAAGHGDGIGGPVIDNPTEELSRIRR